MSFKIYPERGGFIETQEFHRDEDVILVEFNYESSYISFDEKPYFIDEYDPENGILLEDMDGVGDFEYSDGELNITFSDSIPEDERVELEKIIRGDSEKYDESYESVLPELGWESSDSYNSIIGEFEVE